MRLQCTGIRKHFNYKPVLVDINLHVRPTEIYILVGPNGSGKTTLLKILSTLILPDNGNVLINGCDTKNSRPNHFKSKIGCVFPDARSFYWRLTVRQNLLFFGALYGLSGPLCKDRIASMLKELNQEGLADIPVKDCSSGMRQIAAFVRGVLHDPEILLLDEPTRSLSPEMAAAVCQKIRKLSKNDGKIIIMSSHNLSEAEALADRLGIINRGRMVIQGPLADLADPSGHSSESGMAEIYNALIKQNFF